VCLSKREDQRRVCRRWLIAIAFWLSGGFIKSGLGSRIAFAIVSVFGKTTLGLTYSLVFAEALLAPAIPSVSTTTAEEHRGLMTSVWCDEIMGHPV